MATVIESLSHPVSEISFPMIGFCDVNRYNYSKTPEAIKKFFPGQSPNKTATFVNFLECFQNLEFGGFDEFNDLLDKKVDLEFLDHLNITEILLFVSVFFTKKLQFI